MTFAVQHPDINRLWYRDLSQSFAIAAADGDTTLLTGKASYTIYIQRIIVWISTSAAQSWSFEDNNGTPKQVAEIPATPGDSTRWDFDFGEEGVPLTEGKNFVLNVSAAGLAGNITVLAYLKPTSDLVANVAGTRAGVL